MATTKTTTIEFKSDPSTRDNVYNLAKEIASYPQNHDELEILIADRIKKYVHGEKFSVYHRLLMYADAKRFPNEKHLQWFSETCLETKVETHKELYEKWEYGTEYSVRDLMINHEDILKGIYNEERSAVYIAATLDSSGFFYNFDGYNFL